MSASARRQWSKPAGTAAATSLGDAIQRLAARIADAGLPATARLDARLLAAAALGATQAQLVAEPDRLLSENERRRLEELACRRLAHEPVSRILGEREFFGLPFRVTSAVLDPRPDSETVVLTALDLADEGGGRDRPLRLLDLGTGSGALILALLSSLPVATGLGTDVSGAALEIARFNAEAIGLADRCLLVEAGYAETPSGPYDLIVANPPYIPTSEIAGLEPGVRDFDPRIALDGGPDGLAAYRAIAHELPRLLAPGGWVVLEVGVGQAEEVAQIVAGAPCFGRAPPVRHARDLAGLHRCVAIRAQLGET